MNITKFKSAIIISTLLFSFLLINKTQAQTSEHIQNFVSNITIQTDGSLQVDEKIIYDFGANQKHGIFRDIPLTSKDGPELIIQKIIVTAENGESYKHSQSTANKILNIKIGDPNQLVSGVKIYNLHYTVFNAIRPFTDHDELYWNVTGNKWPVGISGASAIIKTPATSSSTLQTICYTGSIGSQEQSCSAAYGGSVASFSTTRPLGVEEGLTISVGMPKGFLNNIYHSPSLISKIGNELSKGWVIAGVSVIVIIILILLIWLTKKLSTPKELRGRPIITEYNPPNNLCPIEVGTIFDRRVDLRDISSIIMDLAVRGYLKIRYTEKEIPLWPDKKDFELVKIKNGDNLTPAERILFDHLFKDGPSVLLSQQKNSLSNETIVSNITSEINSKLRSSGYFQPFLIFLQKLTSHGIEALSKILGFRQFLKMTEADKLKMMNAPDLKPETFEKFLPYAMVLGVEKEWAKKFEGLYNTAPDWYEGKQGTAFSSLLLVHSLSDFNKSFNQSFGIDAGSSGFGGGGSSGGGSGGGGGGSW